MKKAEKIYEDTRFACLLHIKNWGYEVNPDGSAVGFNSLITEKAVSTRTLNDVQKRLDAARRGVDTNEKLGIGTEEGRNLDRQILNMVETTLNNNRKSVEDFNRMLKEI